MLVDKKQLEPWQQGLKLITQCPVCGGNFDRKTAKFFLKKKDSQLVHITCGRCSGNFIANIMIFNKGISTVGMVTDLSYEDAKRIYGSAPIDIDEAIEGYKYLNKFKNIN
jgi:transcription elongation factor Elf1